ncbi:MAG: efflux RND transporter periplasmic adaptor subunit [Candidatus Binatia bacterium]
MIFRVCCGSKTDRQQLHRLAMGKYSVDRKTQSHFIIRSLLVVVLCLAMAGCKREPPAIAALPPPAATVSQPLEREITDYDEYTGRTAAVEEVEIRARVSGYLVKVNFKEGAEVTKGDLLFQIDQRPFQAAWGVAKGQVAQWEAKLTRAEADVARYERLAPRGAASQKDLDTAIADRGEARAAIQSTRAAMEQAALDLEFTRIIAPINGRVSRTLITEGNLVTADTTLLTTIVSMDPMYTYFDIDERSMLRYQQLVREQKRPSARAGQFPITLELANETGFPHQGMIDFIDNKVDPTTGTIRARGVFPNTQRILTPGVFTRVRIQGSGKYVALLVTDRAIGTDQGQKYLLVVNDQNVVEYRAVQLGRMQDDGLRVIPTGLQPGEWVVINGVQRARPGATVSPQRTVMPVQSAAASVTPQTLTVSPQAK